MKKREKNSALNAPKKCTKSDVEAKTFPENQDAVEPSVGWPKNYLGLFRDLVSIIYFLGIKLFLFFKI